MIVSPYFLFKYIASLDHIISICKQRGFIFQSSELYNGIAGFFDYGPLGVEMKNNIKNCWWKDFIRCREDIVGVDCSIISASAIWEASGHAKGFSDLMVDCKESKTRYRADHLYCAKIETRVFSNSSIELGYVCVVEGTEDEMQSSANKQAQSIARKRGVSTADVLPIQRTNLVSIVEALALDQDLMEKLPSPSSGTLAVGVLTPPRAFNLMFRTQVGAVANDEAMTFLRPETAQGIFTNFLNVQRSERLKVSMNIDVYMYCTVLYL
jgi:glycyl-tRNA synthetase